MSDFKRGDVLVFDPSTFNPEFWKQLPENDKIKYYGSLGYGSDKKKFFVFLTEVNDAPGHCVLVDLDNGSVQVMRHMADFRKVTKEEF